MSVIVLQGCKSSPQKSRPLVSGHRRGAVWIAIEYSYKLGHKNEFKLLCELGWFLQRSTVIYMKIVKFKMYIIYGLYWLWGKNKARRVEVKIMFIFSKITVHPSHPLFYTCMYVCIHTVDYVH